MKFKRQLIFLVVCISLIFCGGCMRKDGKQQVDKNVIKDYVRNPLDKAEGARDKVEDKQDRLRRQADLLDR